MSEWYRDAQIELRVAGWKQHPLYPTVWFAPRGGGQFEGIEEALIEKRKRELQSKHAQ